MGIGWSWRLARVAGIPVRVHWSMGLLALALVLVDPSWPGDLVVVVAMALALVASVAAHEVGHGLAARWQGRVVRDIVVLPVGGLTRIEPVAGPASTGDLVIALAGPAMSGLIALACLVLAWLTGGAGLSWLSSRPGAWNPLSPAVFLAVVGGVNGVLLVVNLLPVPPLDGGLAVRALLVPVAGEPAATRLAAGVGLLVAAGVVLAGLLTARWWLTSGGAFLSAVAGAHLRGAWRRPDLSGGGVRDGA